MAGRVGSRQGRTVFSRFWSRAGRQRSRYQPPVAPRSSWGSVAGLPSLACLCLAFMAAAASTPRHPPLRHLHRRERESPIWGRRMVCWFTSTRGRTSLTWMTSIRSATSLRGFRREAWASRLERSVEVCVGLLGSGGASVRAFAARRVKRAHRQYFVISEKSLSI